MSVTGFGTVAWLSLVALPVLVAVVALTLGKYEHLFNSNRKQCAVSWLNSTLTWSFGLSFVPLV